MVDQDRGDGWFSGNSEKLLVGMKMMKDQVIYSGLHDCFVIDLD